MKKTIVMKFGGASVASPQHFSKIADIILERLTHFSRLAIVVSAMGDTTNQLISLAKQVHPNPPTREYAGYIISRLGLLEPVPGSPPPARAPGTLLCIPLQQA